MIFVVTVDPAAKVAERIEVENATHAYAPMRLNPFHLDGGVLFPVEPAGGVAFVVGMFAMYEPADAQRYFSVGPRLLAGNAVLYQFDGNGQSISFDEELMAQRTVPTWYDTAADVEAAIAAGAIIRPTMTGPEGVIWQWPEPAPPTIAAGMKAR